MSNGKNKINPVSVYPFATTDPFQSCEDTTQIQYIRSYLSDLGASTVIEEPNYFDRDYLSEFSSFYSTSAFGYPNVCKRLHFFNSEPFTKRRLLSAAGGSETSLKKLQDSYLGFTVLRPIPAAPLGRTVLGWYPEQNYKLPRVKTPSRSYKIHIMGLELQVEGLAWQQQDSGVAACATIGLWTMLHSSAFDDHHAIPTTTEITKAAHSDNSYGRRVFPSTGLTVHQICEAVKHQDLGPTLIDGDVKHDVSTVGFGKERFSSSCASFIRSGYPVLLIGFRNEGHAVCAVGFRSSAGTKVPQGEIGLQDSEIDYIYIHDDNMGPNVRYKITTKNIDIGNKKSKEVVSLIPDNPPPLNKNPPYPQSALPSTDFIPQHILVAVHNDLKTNPDKLHKIGGKITKYLSYIAQQLAVITKTTPIGLTFSTRFIKLSDYMDGELRNRFGTNKKLLAKVRKELCENVPPMSLHLGVVRIALPDSSLILDILFDTTDSDRHHPAFTHICFVNWVDLALDLPGNTFKLGTRLLAY